MSNQIFDALLREKVDVFRAAFSSVSTEVFYDPQRKKLIHAGEYGVYRERIVRDFLRFIVPLSLDFSTGFVITSMDDVSSQCDLLIFDSKMTPLYQEGDKHRFFPIESLFCIGEVKSVLTKKALSKALNKLSEIKKLSERISDISIVRKNSTRGFNPVIDPHDMVPTILICQKLKFNLNNIENEIDDLYDHKVEHRHKHNIIFSIDDGMLTYHTDDKNFMPYPMAGEIKFKHRYVWPVDNSYVHFKHFAAYMYMLTANKTLLYPDIASYLIKISGGLQKDQL